MAEIVVGLSKSVVQGALTKVQSAIEEDAKLRQKAQGDLVSITLEFEMMQSFLDVSKEESITKNMVRTWVKHVRELAYDVEDCVEFVVHLDNTPDWWRRLLPSCVAPPLPLDQAVQELEELKRRVEDVNNCYRRYSNINDSGSSSKPLLLLQQPASDAAIVDTAALNMIAEARAAAKRQQGLCDLAKLVMNEDGDNDLQVIAMWGTGGDLGRTSSVIWKAYNEQQIYTKFTCRAWVKLMHPFNPSEFVQSLTADFFATTYQEQQGEVVASDVLLSMKDEHTQEFLQQLTTKRYLIVLEDLSSMADWRAIRTFLPNMKNGSCIIVSLQQFVVAHLCTGRPCQLLELEQFSADHSVYAFIKKRYHCDVDKGEETDDNKASANSLVTNSVRQINMKKRMLVKGMDSARSIKKTINPVQKKGKTINHLKKAAGDWIKNHALVGRESEMNDLRQYTRKARFYSFQVMSVWGIPGVGKSALLKNLYYEIILEDLKLLEKEKPSIFDKYAWVDVSYPFNLRDFFQSLLLNFHSQPLQANKEDPIQECREILKQHKCLVVIDGLQSTKEWDLISQAAELVSQAEEASQSSKNCIIVITTESSIAKHCRRNKGELVFNVKGLQADAAFDIFKYEVSRINPRHSSLFDTYTVEFKELISKCGGLPKVITEIASSLDTKTVGLMERACSLSKNFMHALLTNPEFHSLQGLFGWLRTYYGTCPDALKLCIHYLSIFTRSNIIRRRRLVRRWIAEGYSRDNHEESAEENGENHFSNLLDMSIIQRPPEEIASTALGDTRVVLCHVNGFIGECMASQRMEENFVFELRRNCALTTQRRGRHLIILDDWDRDKIVFKSTDFSRLRSLTVFGKWESFFISESMKILRVLYLEDAKGMKDSDVEKMVKLLPRLKFLSLRGCPEICHLPSSLGDLRQLQTLDVRDTSIVTLPENIIKLQKLQYIRAGSGTKEKTLGALNQAASAPPVSSGWLPEFCKRRQLVGVVVPGGIGKLTALHTLGVVNVAASGGGAILKELKKLTQLRKLGVAGINKKNSKDLFSSIKCHVHLESLSVQLNKDNTRGCLDDMISLPLDNLRSLKLYGLNDKLPEWGRYQLRKLAKLDLEMATLLGNDMMSLGKLPQLCVLRVRQLRGDELCFCARVNNVEACLRKVKVLEIACGCSSRSLHVTFGSRTMRKLELLKVDCLGGSPTYKFSGLENLGLKQVLLLNGSNAQALKELLESQLAEHPNKPVVKLEEPPRSS